MKAHELVDKLIQSIESGCQPWQRPFDSAGGGLPLNPTTQRKYSGGNVLLLWMTQTVESYPTSLWLGFNQGKSLGGTVRKGEHGTHVIIYRQGERENASGESEYYRFLSTKPVFNLAQFDGLEHLLPQYEKHDWLPSEETERVLTESKAVIEYGGDRACFIPSLDKICLPERERFHSADSFAATALHELTHWTGHKDRLNREFGKRFGSEAYAFEELVAEIGSAFIQAEIGLNAKIENHASYIESWLKVLHSDKTAILTAARLASTSTEYLLKGKNHEHL